MSNKALTWAFEVQSLTPSQKFVLVAMADLANEIGHSYPSCAHLCGMTSLDRKTVLQALDGLQEAGLIKDTGEKKGKTKQVRVFKLSLGSDLEEAANDPKNGTIPEMEPVPFFPANGTTFDGKRSQKRDTEPLEPLRNPQEGVLKSSQGKAGRQKTRTWSTDAVESRLKPKTYEAVCEIIRGFDRFVFFSDYSCHLNLNGEPNSLDGEVVAWAKTWAAKRGNKQPAPKLTA